MPCSRAGSFPNGAPGTQRLQELLTDSQLSSWKACYRIPGMCLELRKKIPKITSINTQEGMRGELGLAATGLVRAGSPQDERGRPFPGLPAVPLLRGTSSGTPQERIEFRANSKKGRETLFPLLLTSDCHPRESLLLMGRSPLSVSLQTRRPRPQTACTDGLRGQVCWQHPQAAVQLRKQPCASDDPALRSGSVLFCPC